MGRFELVHEAGEKVHVLGVAGGGVVVNEIAATAAEDFAHGSGGEIAELGDDVARAEEGEQLVRIAEEATLERIDEERQTVGVAADNEVAGEADGFEFETEALADEQVNNAERRAECRCGGRGLGRGSCSADRCSARGCRGSPIRGRARG